MKHRFAPPPNLPKARLKVPRAYILETCTWYTSIGLYLSLTKDNIPTNTQQSVMESLQNAPGEFLREILASCSPCARTSKNQQQALELLDKIEQRGKATGYTPASTERKAAAEVLKCKRCLQTFREEDNSDRSCSLHDGESMKKKKRKKEKGRRRVLSISIPTFGPWLAGCLEGSAPDKEKRTRGSDSGLKIDKSGTYGSDFEVFLNSIDKSSVERSQQQS